MGTKSTLQHDAFRSGLVNYNGDIAEPPLIWNYTYLKKTSTVTSGDGVQGWKQKIAMGQNCTTSLTGLKYTLVKTPGRAYLRLKRKSGQNPAVHTLYKINDRVGYFSIPIDYPVFSVPGSLVTQASNMAKQRLMANIIEQQQAFQSLVFAGEGRETVRMIRGAGQEVQRRYTDYLEDVKRRSRTMGRAVDKKLKALANLWLLAQYGIKPLLNDIDQGAYALANDYSIRPQHKLVTGVGEVDGDWTQVGSNNVVHGGFSVPSTTEEWAHVIVIYRAMVGLNRSEFRRQSSRNLGVSLDAFLPSVYELIPYSFLLDYFTNVNEIVNAWSYGRTGVWWSAETIIQERKRRARSHQMIIANPGVSYDIDDYEYSPCSLISSVRSVNRGTYTGSFIPSLEFELPNSATRVANIGALAYNHKSALRAVFPKKEIIPKKFRKRKIWKYYFDR